MKTGRKKIKLKEKELNKILLTLAKKGYKAKKELAEHLEVPQSSVSMWLRDGFIPAKHYDKVMDYLIIK
jgi:Mn-dependent DtxR family transcriptional regulator